MAAAPVVQRSFVEVYVWLAKDRDGHTTTSSEGGSQAQQANRGLARCGHVSMEMFPAGKPSVYVSLWPGRDAPAVTQLSLAHDMAPGAEGTKPDVILRLHNLAVNSMVDSFAIQKKRVDKGEVRWVLDISDSEDVTNGGKTANCASFVYSFLKIGGLGKPSSVYYQKSRSTGPADSDFYYLTKCNAGDRWGGYFNWAPWTSWYFTPKALLLCAAAAAGTNALDKEATTGIMKSDRVAVERQRVWSTGEKVNAGLAVVGVAAILITKALVKK